MNLLTKKLLCTAIVQATLCSSVFAADVFVAKNGVDEAQRSGSINEPYATANYALDFVGPGDTLYFRAGTYYDTITQNDVQGNSDNWITISAYNGEQVTFDGTVAVDTGWSQHSGNIYKTVVPENVWQLFVDDEQMIPARWPDARFDDSSIYTDGAWAKAIQDQSSISHLVTDPTYHDLAASGIDATNAVIVANVGSYITYSRKVTSHTAGSNEFDLEATPNLRKNPKYFLEGKLELLNQEKEWFFDVATNTAYLWAPGGGAPTGTIRGKARGYAVDVARWSFVTLEGIDFFATTLKCGDCKSLTLENIDFKYGGSSQRMLGITDTKGHMLRIVSNAGANSDITIRNVNISDTDAQALILKADHSLIENSSFVNIDYAAADAYTPGANVVSQGTANTFRYNTISKGGNSTGIATNGWIVAQYNEISDIGFAQNDGAMIQIGVDEQKDSILAYNWTHSAEGKYGLRFDAPNPATVWGDHGFMHNNVAWDSKGIMVKGEYNRDYHNLAFNNEKMDMRIMTDGGANIGTQTIGNAADSISGERSDHVAVPGVVGTNFDALSEAMVLIDQIRDVSNRDFRPKPDSVVLVDAGDVISDSDFNQVNIGDAPDIGAYESGNTHYWIPGQKQALASKPIPRDAGTADDAADLMWQEAYQANEHHVYFGTNQSSVAAATASSTEYKGSFTTGNIYEPGTLAFNTYYWRVDALIDNQVVKGTVWSFTVDRNYVTAPKPIGWVVTEELYADDFEVNNMSNYGISGDGVTRINAAAYTGSYGSRIKGTSTLTLALDTTGYQDIVWNFNARTKNYEENEVLKFEWTADGSNWHLLGSTNTTAYGDFSLTLPASADNNPDVKIRFNTNGSQTNERSEIDNIVVNSVALP